VVEGIQEKRLGEHGERSHSKEKVDEHSLKLYVLRELMHILLRANWGFEELIPSVLS